MTPGDFPFRRNTTIEPVFVGATDVGTKVTVPDLRNVQGVTSFGVDNTFPCYIRLVGTGYGAAQFNQANEGKGWIFGPGKHGPFSTQFPEFMSAVQVERPGYPIKDANGALLYPNAGLEVFYGSGNGGWGGAGTPYVFVRGTTTVSFAGGSSVNVGNFPATQQVSGTVNVGNFPASQAVTGTFWQAVQPVSGTVSISGTVQIADSSGSITIDTGTTGVFAPTPSGMAQYGIVPYVAPAGTVGVAAKTSAGNLYSVAVIPNPNGPNFYLIALNRTTVPAAGATLAQSEMLGVTFVYAAATGNINPDDIPDRYSTGIVIICSTTMPVYTPLTTSNAPYHIKARFV